MKKRLRAQNVCRCFFTARMQGNAVSLGAEIATLQNKLYSSQALSYFTVFQTSSIFQFPEVVPKQWPISFSNYTFSNSCVQRKHIKVVCVQWTPTVYVKQKLPRESHVWFLYVGVCVCNASHEASSAKLCQEKRWAIFHSCTLFAVRAVGGMLSAVFVAVWGIIPTWFHIYEKKCSRLVLHNISYQQRYWNVHVSYYRKCHITGSTMLS